LFTTDGEIAVGGGPVLVKGREALMEQARRDHDRFGDTDANGRWTSIMRHLISNAQITVTGDTTAEGTCYVTTVVRKGGVGPAILSISRYVDRYVKANGEWRIERREIFLEFGNDELAVEMGFRDG
jgi:3-phenylpropionate/cinnamic acid dioxygenase small subunit